MNRLFHILLGIKPAPWAEGGSWRIEWLAMPRHDRLFLLVVVVLLGAWGVLYLYRREGRNLRFPVRLGLSALRWVVLLGVVAMLLEPVIVFTKKEFVPSNLLVLTDQSESMELRDAFIDSARATKLVEALKLGSPNELRERSRAALAQRALETGLFDALGAKGDRNVRVQGFAGQLIGETASGSRATTQAATTRPASTTQPGS